MLFTEALTSNWRVTFGPRVNIRQTPALDGNLVGKLELGSVVRASHDPQHANWVRLADGRGHVMIKHPEHGQLLVPTSGSSVSLPSIAEKPELKAARKEVSRDVGAAGASLLDQVEDAEPAVRLEILRTLLRDASLVEKLAAPYPINVA